MTARRALLALALLLLWGCKGEGRPSTETTPMMEAETASASPSASDPASDPAPASPSLPTRPGDPPAAPPFSAPLHARLLKAAEAATPEMLRHTRNRSADGSPRYRNRLLLETSPYLLQHAFNPVDWHPFGPAALEEARRRNVPIFLSIGYATCHWCHVMARESFEEPEVARYLNAHYVPIKVDREERPDLDRVYMSVVQMLTGGGGWPMTIILTPEMEPLFGGTYLPPRDRGRRPGLLTVVQSISETWTRDPESTRQRAARIAARLVRSTRPAPPAGLPSVGAVKDALAAITARQDEIWGGFGRAPKFPRPANLAFLLHRAHRSGDEAARVALVRTLDGMALGGIHDQVGGGFHRYSVDRSWHVPHFEKMLYDNAQLAPLYLESAVAFGLDRHRRVGRRALDLLLRDFRGPDGGFVSAIDADSPRLESGENRPAGGGGHAEEGLFYTWTPAELEAALGADEARRVARVFHVAAAGNFEGGRSILYLDGPSEKDPGSSLAAARALLPALEKLRAVRARRPPPETDRKRVTAWNALAVSAFARASWLLDAPRYLQVARRTMRWLLGKVWAGEQVHRTYHRGRVGNPGVLRDYAFMVQALLDLFEADPDPAWLLAARAIQSAQDGAFGSDPPGAYLHIAAGSALPVRRTHDYDGAEPAGNSVSAWNLIRLAALTGEERYEEAADALLGSFGRQLSGGALGLPMMMDALAARLGGLRELVIVAPEGSPRAARALLEVARSRGSRDLVRIVATEGPGLERLMRAVPWVEGKIARRGKATAYLCRKRVCKRPTSDPETLRKLLVAP